MTYELLLSVVLLGSPAQGVHGSKMPIATGLTLEECLGAQTAVRATLYESRGNDIRLGPYGLVGITALCEPAS